MNQLTLIAEHSSPVGLADAVPRLVAVAVLAAGMHQALVAVLARPSGPATGFGGTKSKSSDKSDIGTQHRHIRLSFAARPIKEDGQRG
jgi:hypothetical protein